MMHVPTRAVFSIYLADGADPAAPSLSELRARLAHICDGHAIPGDLADLGARAIDAFACMTERVRLAEHPDRDDQSLF